MGNKALTQRQLGKTISKAYEPVAKQAPKLPLEPQKPPQFDAAKLTQKLQNKHGNAPPNTAVTPPGKDGFDPQIEGTSTYDTDFVDSVTRLGRQVNLILVPQVNADALSLRQLNNRKQLWDKGETQKHNHDTAKLLVNPQTLSAIVSDLRDGFAPAKVADDYGLEPQMVDNLLRFSMAKTVVVMKEEPKKGELTHRATGLGRIEAEDNDRFDKERLKKLKLRISVE